MAASVSQGPFCGCLYTRALLFGVYIVPNSYGIASVGALKDHINRRISHSGSKALFGFHIPIVTCTLNDIGNHLMRLFKVPLIQNLAQIQNFLNTYFKRGQHIL